MKKIKQWSDWINPINSAKVLVHGRQIEEIIKGNYPPPVFVEFYPTNKCNASCPHCSTSNFRDAEQLTREDGIKTIEMLKEWGVRTIYFCGGGEPTHHPNFLEFLLLSKELGFQIGLITNGINLHKFKEHLLDIDLLGVSLDAFSPSTWGSNKFRTFDKDKNGGKYTKKFRRIIDALAYINEHKNPKMVTTYKFVVMSNNGCDNTGEILNAAELAKEIKCSEIFFRPIHYWDKDDVKKDDFKTKLELDRIVDKTEDIREKLFKLDDDNFRVYFSIHRFDSFFKRGYKKCWSAPLAVTLGADGMAYVCCDTLGILPIGRYNEAFEPNDFWNTSKHKKIMNSIDVDKCPRCKQNQYNEIIQKTFIEGRMLHNFL